MGEKFTSRVGYLIRNFRIASDMTQKELADKCGLNESTIRNYELGNRYPDCKCQHTFVQKVENFFVQLPVLCFSLLSL